MSSSKTKTDKKGYTDGDAQPPAVPTSSVVSDAQPTASTTAVETVVAPSKPVKKAVENYFRIQIAKDTEPTQRFMDEVKGCTDARKRELMTELMDEMKVLAVKHSFIEKSLKDEKKTTNDDDEKKYQIEVRYEGHPSFRFQASSSMTWAQVRDDSAKHFGILKTKFRQFTLMSNEQNIDCLESARATIGGKTSQDKGLEPVDGSIYRLVAYQWNDMHRDGHTWSTAICDFLGVSLLHSNLDR